MTQNYVLGFAFNEDQNQVCLIEKVKPKWQKGLLNGIGGSIEKIDKSLEDAMVREFSEETGVLTTIAHWKRVGVSTRDQEFSCYIFTTKLPMLQYAAVRTNTIERVEWFPLEHIYKYRHRLIPNLPGWIGLCLDPQHPEVRIKYS